MGPMGGLHGAGVTSHRAADGWHAARPAAHGAKGRLTCAGVSLTRAKGASAPARMRVTRGGTWGGTGLASSRRQVAAEFGE